MDDFLNKTLAQLKIFSNNDLEYDSYLVRTLNQLSNKKLIAFTIEDLRIMIGQNIGLQLLIPIAIKELKKNLFAEGHFYPGDLLQSVLNVETEYWEKHPSEWENLHRLLIPQMEKLEKHKPRIDRKSLNKFLSAKK